MSEQLKSPQAAIDLLNKAFEIDPEALHSLICNRVACKEKLGDDTAIVITGNPALGKDNYVVGLIGILNGVLNALGYQNVALQIEQSNDNHFHQLKGFCEWKPPSGE